MSLFKRAEKEKAEFRDAPINLDEFLAWLKEIKENKSKEAYVKLGLDEFNFEHNNFLIAYVDQAISLIEKNSNLLISKIVITTRLINQIRTVLLGNLEAQKEEEENENRRTQNLDEKDLEERFKELEKIITIILNRLQELLLARIEKDKFN